MPLRHQVSKRQRSRKEIFEESCHHRHARHFNLILRSLQKDCVVFSFVIPCFRGQAARRDCCRRSRLSLSDLSQRITQDGRHLFVREKLQGFVWVLAGPTRSTSRFDFSRKKVLRGTTFFTLSEREDEDA